MPIVPKRGSRFPEGMNCWIYKYSEKIKLRNLNFVEEKFISHNLICDYDKTNHINDVKQRISAGGLWPIYDTQKV